MNPEDKNTPGTALPPRPDATRLLRSSSVAQRERADFSRTADLNKMRSLRGVVEQSENVRGLMEADLSYFKDANSALKKEMLFLKSENQRSLTEILLLKDQLSARDKLIQNNEEAVAQHIRNLLQENSTLARQNDLLQQKALLCQQEAIELRSQVIRLTDELHFVDRLKSQLLQNNDIYARRIAQTAVLNERLRIQSEQIEAQRQRLQQAVDETKLEKQLLQEQNQLYRNQLQRKSQAIKKLGSKKARASQGQQGTDQEVGWWLQRVSDEEDASLQQCAKRCSKFISSFMDMAERLFGEQRYRGLRWGKRLQTAWQDIKTLVAGQL